MSLFEMLVIAAALSMDAFAVSMCKGLSLGRIKPGHALVCGAYFGGFQAVMPIFGFCLAGTFRGRIDGIANYIAVILLAMIGINMLREAFSGEERKETPDVSPGAMIPLAAASSIDAFAAGVSFALVMENGSRGDIWLAAAIIGTFTFGVSAVGVKAGSIFGDRYKKAAEAAGGGILVLMGIKILLEQIGIL